MLEQMKNIDVRTVDRDTLVDATGVTINMDLPKRERMMDSAKRLGNPYCFRCGKVVVKLSHADTAATIDDRVESYLRTL